MTVFSFCRITANTFFLQNLIFSKLRSIASREGLPGYTKYAKGKI